MNSWTTAWGDGGFCYLPYQFLANPSLSYDWEALKAFNMSATASGAVKADGNATSVRPGDSRPVNAQGASGAYFGADPDKKPSLLQRLCCCS